MEFRIFTSGIPLPEKSQKDCFTRSNFKDPIFDSENWKQVFRRSDFKVPFLCRKVNRNVIVMCLLDPIFRTNKES